MEGQAATGLSFDTWSYFWPLFSLFLVGLFSYLYVKKAAVDRLKIHPVSQVAAMEAEERLTSLDQSELSLKLRELEEEYSQRRLAFSSLFLNLKDMATCIDPARIMQLCLKCLRQGLEVRKALLLIVDEREEGSRLYPASSLGYDPGELEEILVSSDEMSILGVAVRTGALVSERTVRESPVWDARIISDGVLPSVVACPLMAGGKVKGVITVQESAAEIDEPAERFAATVASVTSLALDNARAFELTRQELSDARELGEEERRQKELVKSLFQRYLAPEVIEELVTQSDLSTMLVGCRREVTVLFMDARGFTTYSETHEPEEVVAVLNEYLSAIAAVVVRHGGIVDKFVGDEVVALWGAPIERADHAQRALLAAFEMIEAMARLQDSWLERGIEPLDVGIGINTGLAIIGNIGSETRLDYTAIGDTVNLGARLEALTRQYGCYLIIGPRTRVLAGEIIQVESLGKVGVKGKKVEVDVFRVTSLRDPRHPDEWIPMREPFALVTGDRAREMMEKLSNGTPQEKKDTLIAMGASGQRFFLPVLEKALDIEPAGLRFFARRAYHNLRDTLQDISPDGEQWIDDVEKSAYDKCVEMLQSNNYNHRVGAVLGLERISKISSEQKREAIIELYRNLLKKEDHSFVLATLARTLGTVGGRECAAEVAEFLKHPDPRVIANAIDGLAACPQVDHVPLIEPFSHSPDNRIRANALKFLGMFKSGNATDEINRMLTDSEDEDYVREGLKESARFILQENDDLQEADTGNPEDGINGSSNPPVP